MTDAPLSRNDVYSARPTIRADGRDVPHLPALLLSFSVDEDGAGLASAEVVLTNWITDEGERARPAFEDERSIALGSELAIYAGDVNRPREVFRGVVTALEAEWPERAAPQLTVLAEDALQKARMARRTKLWRDTKLADVAEAVARAAGIRASVDGFRESLGDQLQLNESDLAFLRRLLDARDADVQVVGGELHVAARTSANRGTVELRRGSRLRHTRFSADLAHQVSQVTVAGWDPAQGAAVRATKAGDHLGPGAGRTGAELLERALVRRSEHFAHVVPSTQAEADGLAAAVFDERARSFVRVDATTEGDPLIRVGAEVSLTGFSARFDNTYAVVRTRHRFDLERGYETDFVARSAYLGAPS